MRRQVVPGHLLRIERHAHDRSEAIRPLEEVAIDVLAGRVEVTDVDQRRLSVLIPDVTDDLIDVALRRVAAEREDRDA